MQAIRGAITVSENSAPAILQATQLLLLETATRNQLAASEIISIIFTATPDLNAAFPAKAARELGWTEVALLDAVEMDVPLALPHTIRLLMFVDRRHGSRAVSHVYLGRAVALRPDLSARQPG